MKTIHSTTIVGKCPLGCANVYVVEFHVEGRVLPVEQIQEAVDRFTKEPAFQEDLTQRLADLLGCEVMTTGTHGRFGTVCRCQPARGR